MLKNDEVNFGSIAKFFHWFMAIAIICLLIIGYNLEFLRMHKVHKTVGFIILIIVPIRILWRLSNKIPQDNSDIPNFLKKTAILGHWTLYILMFLVPLSAFTASNAAHRPVSFFFLFDMPSLFAEKNIELAKMAMEAHEALSAILAWVIAGHFLAALYHHFIRKDNILKKMWFSNSKDIAK